MSNCGCTGHYHNGGCSDQNVIWWRGAPHGIPVNPTQAEIREQIDRLVAELPPAEQVAIRQQFLDNERMASRWPA